MSSNSPCAACKFQRRKCTPECIFAPYFPPEDPQKFVNVHKVFGGSNVSKILSDINPAQREDAAKSLAYEAQARLQNPVYGCVSMITYLQQKLNQIHVDLDNAKKELASYVGPSAMLPTSSSSYPPQAYGQMVYQLQPHLQQQQQQHQMMGNPAPSSSVLPYTNLMGNPTVYGAGPSQQLLVIGDQQQPPQTALPYTSLIPSMMSVGDPSQSVVIREQQPHQQQQHNEVDSQIRYGGVVVEHDQNELMIRRYEIQHQQDYVLFRNSTDQQHQYDDENNAGGQIAVGTSTGFIQMADHEEINNGGGPSLALGVSYDHNRPSYNQIHHQHCDNNAHRHAVEAQQLVLQSQQNHPEHLLRTAQLHQQPQHNKAAAETDER